MEREERDERGSGDERARCILHPDVLEKLAFLEEVQADGVERFVSAISTPGNRFCIRLNTLACPPGEAMEMIRENHPGLQIERDQVFHEVAWLPIKGPFEIHEKPKAIEVDKFAAEAVRVSAPLFAPGVKTPLTSFKRGDLVSIKHHFRAPWDRSIHEFHVGNGVAKVASGEVDSLERGVVIHTTESTFQAPSIHRWNEHDRGLVFDQNYPSIVAARLLDPLPGSIVLDACAGAGGKTTHLAQLMEDRGRIVAVDRSRNRLETLRRRADRMGMTCIETVQSKIRHIEDRLEASFEPTHVLVDPPCSALGLRARLYINENAGSLDNYVINQRRIWEHILPLVGSGTRCVYSTCTVTIDENEGIVEHLVRERGFRILEPRFRLGSPGIPTGTLGKNDARRLTRFYPFLHDGPGFFIAVLEKE